MAPAATTRPALRLFAANTSFRDGCRGEALLHSDRELGAIRKVRPLKTLP